ncbi:glycosyltransferase family 4 protein [Cocleimonas flava]|uniref:Glycosyltransferase involved in cell wall biosynthesis n=1 Tax=Cocleimonas flava TaxID=634765 RepID=A0A4R1ENY8_9GAMM|nr:glycosyltransferase family 4 protein [Cocleimonas flava]TCJ82986.1 glycosyltransferase involved in cell wall biosynthesis [Cocleimonas flava]
MTKQLTILQLLPDLESGGVEKGTLEVAKAIVDAGHRSIVMSAGGRLVKRLEEEGSEHIFWDLGKKSPLTFLQGTKLRAWLQQNKIDIIHARSRMPAWVAWLAWRKMPSNNRPHFITTMHGLNSVSRYSKIMTYGEKVIAVSDTVKSYILDKYPETNEDKIITIARGIDIKEFPFHYQPEAEWLAAWYQEYPQTQGKWVITLPGRLTRLKGHNDFLDVLNTLKSENLNVHGLIVGGEDPKRKQYAQELYARVKSDGLDDYVTFAGYRSDMKEIYAISNAVLSLSTQPESFGRTAVEAISLGTPVIAYNHGGVGETMGQVYPAGLVGLNDTEETAIRCKQLYNGNIQAPQGELAVYSKQEMLDKTLALYDALSEKN